ncbi:MAG: ATP synthase F1 subunit delta [Planctomycetes bacterium]|nr:ATP synthase F1 subunit delta [Planctomycetota bacterium]
MSTSSSIAAPYARALSSLVLEESALLSLVEECFLIREVLWGDPTLLRYLKSPKIPRSRKGASLRAALSQAGVNDWVMRLMIVLVNKDKIAIFPEFCTELRTIADRRCGVLRGKVESAVELDAPQRDQLEGVLAERFGKKIAMDYRVSPEILGGLRLNLGNTRVDSSLAGKLAGAAERLLATKTRA